ncbi:GNAT family N-acetyltransferase [Nocardioides euryhalodurans]|uniref:GNAT family N-acetyltransferase n=1 Tax=Nocardioides euryhalodurans TaxID=2518370 RepID=A0A4P7GLN0_9ACTN|nr:GNAT family N-acetyltransferase [Nocardioides euryhalodurans]QBR93006.1 GNAT family N-acetyltransferase [Nocardioides euryhalodurans]
MELPDGLTSRPLEARDARAVFEVMAAQEMADLGMVEIEEADIVGDWGRPSFDVGDSTVGVFDGDRLVAYAEISGHDRGDAALDPAMRGRGIGTALALWMQDKVRSRGGSVIGMPVPEGSPGDRLLEELGYRVRWTSWVLKLPAGATIVERPLPDGYAVRAAEPAEYPAVHTVAEDAFLEWSEREREPYEDFIAQITGRPGFEPWQLRVVVDGAGEVVGVAHVTLALTEDERPPEAYVARLAVRRDQRHRGLAQALMVDAFAVAREHGAESSCLSTDSRTGALGLYEKVGMEVTSVWVNRAIDL